MKTATMKTIQVGIAVGVWLAATAARAGTWTGGGGDDNWSTPGNWSDSADPAGKAIVFDSTDMAAKGTANNIVNQDYSINTLTLTNVSNVGLGHTISIPAGVTLAVTGAVTIALTQNGGPTGYTTDVYVAGGGTLAVSNNVQVGHSSGYGRNIFFSLTNLNTFIINATGNRSVVVGVGNQSYSETLRLAVTNRLKTGQILVGTSTGGTGQGSTQLMELGRVNEINASTNAIGAYSYAGRIAFQAGLGTDPLPSVTFRNMAGTGRVQLMVLGQMYQTGGNWAVGTVDLSGGTVDAQIGDLFLGWRPNNISVGAAGSSVGILTMTAGLLDVTNAVLGYAQGGTNGSGTTSGTLNLYGGTCVVQRLRLGVMESGSTNPAFVIRGRVNLSSSTLRAGTIVMPPLPDTAGTNQAYFNWTNGTIGNITGGDLTISNVPLTLTTAGAHTFDADAGRTITLYSAVTGGVGVAFQKTGDGTLKFGAGNLVGTNLDLTLSGGTLNSGGFDQTFRKLTLNGDAVIDFGSGNSVLTFADSASQTWTGSLTVTNWSGLDGGGGDDRLFIGTSAGGLTSEQLARITMNGRITKQLPTGEIVFRALRGTMLGIY